MRGGTSNDGCNSRHCLRCSLTAHLSSALKRMKKDNGPWRGVGKVAIVATRGGEEIGGVEYARTARFPFKCRQMWTGQLVMRKYSVLLVGHR